MKTFLAVLIAGFFAFSAMAQTESATPEDAKELVLKAADVLAKDGKEKAYRAYQDRSGPYWKGELYVFIINFDGVWESYPPKPEAVGTSLLTLKDIDGNLFVKAMIDVAQTRGEGWVDYKWKNPETNRIQPKTSYVKRVGDVLVGAGVYK